MATLLVVTFNPVRSTADASQRVPTHVVIHTRVLGQASRMNFFEASLCDSNPLPPISTRSRSRGQSSYVMLGRYLNEGVTSVGASVSAR
ncbi:hypothetical protein PoMZ_07024 [Pyricularia oryzae]|uniref:Uncharacterized protein n=1 Tax=Pyricularia oryzae TaxID=318829 RepID=A0A4P7NS97_PYROR|nr:hypothetical protein PoMZ_07024 [Pyricularia oryzae]